MSQFKAIIFDMDGTLVDSEVVWEVAEDEMFRERGIIMTSDVRQQVIGLRLDEFFQKLITIYELEESIDALMEELVQRMLTKIPQQLEAKQGAQALIDWVADQSIPYCIASSSPMSIIEAAVKSQDWQARIPKLYTADSVARGKPAPDIYLHAAQKLGVVPENCLAIEDSPNGAKSAVAAGMTCYVVPDGHTPAEKFVEITPHIFSSLNEILEHLQS